MDITLSPDAAVKPADQGDTAPAAPSSHLEKQQVMLTGRLAKLEAEFAETDHALAVALPSVHQQLADFGAAFRALCARRKEQLAEDAYAQSAWKCLTLGQLKSAQWAANTNAFVVAWMAIIAVFVAVFYFLPAWGYFSMVVAAAAAIFLYRKFLKQARREYAKQTSAAAVAAIAAVENYDPLLVHLGSTPSGDKLHPYNSVEVTAAAAAYVDRARNFDVNTFGDMYSATLLGFGAMEGRIGMWITLPDGAHALRCVDLSDKQKMSALFSDVSEALLALAASQSETMIHAIHALSEKVARRRGAVAELALLKARLQSLASQEAAWRNVAVNRDALDPIVVHIELFKLGKAGAPKGILLYGPPGTGKTSIARNLAATSGCHFMTVDLADLKGKHQGHTAPAVVEVWNKARAKAPCILFVDECESIFGTRAERSAGGHNVNFDNELIETFLQQWDGINSSSGQVFVVGATNRRDNIDTAIESRFNKMIEIGLPDVNSRRRILELEFGKRSINLDVSAKMAKETAGMSGRDLSTLATSFQGATLLADPSEELFTAVVKESRGKASTLTEGVTWDEVILDAAFKTKLEGIARKIKRAEEYLKAGFQIPKSLLLYGPPGTGKTQIARAMATESGIAFQAVTTGDIKGAYAGESGKQVKRIFEAARAQAPCLLFIDEIDIITGSRGQGDRASQEIVGQMLQEMDGIKSRAGAGFVFVLAATNCREDIDQAILSRFGDQEEVALPDTEARSAILQVLLKGKPLGFDLPSVAPRLAAATEGFSGRDLGTLVKTAAGNAMQRADDDGLEIEDIRILEADFEARTNGNKAPRAA
jgi:transitional endoplasmic reticulum ATPase